MAEFSPASAATSADFVDRVGGELVVQEEVALFDATVTKNVIFRSLCYIKTSKFLFPPIPNSHLSELLQAVKEGVPQFACATVVAICATSDLS